MTKMDLARAIDDEERNPFAVHSARSGLVPWAAIAALMALDLLADRGLGASALHLALQVTAILLALSCALTALHQLVSMRSRVAALDAELGVAHRDAERWHEEARSALHGLGEAVGQQFQRWDFTPAEREVAVMLLKGLSHRQIAQARGTGEATVRQQSLALYRKAGLSGRAGLSAFFLSGLLLPR